MGKEKENGKTMIFIMANGKMVKEMGMENWKETNKMLLVPNLFTMDIG